MNNKLLILLSLLCLYSCDKPKNSSTFSDDYVLIEFAAKLEEDYEKLYPQPLDKQKSQREETGQ